MEKDVDIIHEGTKGPENFNASLRDFKESMEKWGYKQTIFGRISENIRLFFCFGDKRKMWEATRFPYIRELMCRIERGKNINKFVGKSPSRMDDFKSVLEAIEKDKENKRRYGNM